MDYADRACDLECVRGQQGEPLGKRHEFVGPVKIVLVDQPSPANYTQKAWGSAIINFALLLIGATVFTVFAFTMKYKLPIIMNLHIVMCTMAFQLFLPIGILMINSLFGGTEALKKSDRRCQHVFIQVFTVACGTGGTALIVFLLGFMPLIHTHTVHALTGVGAAIGLVLTSMIGPMVLLCERSKFFRQCIRNAHATFGVLSFTLGTISFITGLWKPSFVEWAPIQNLPSILFVFTFFSTAAIFFSMYMRSICGP